MYRAASRRRTRRRYCCRLGGGKYIVTDMRGGHFNSENKTPTTTSYARLMVTCLCNSSQYPSRHQRTHPYIWRQLASAALQIFRVSKSRHRQSRNATSWNYHLECNFMRSSREKKLRFPPYSTAPCRRPRPHSASPRCHQCRHDGKAQTPQPAWKSKRRKCGGS